MSDYTPSLDEVLSEALMEVYDNGTNPNALREARAVIARVGESAWAEAVRAEEREKADRMGPAAGCAYCVGAGGYEDYDGEWRECSCQRADREPSDAVVEKVRAWTKVATTGPSGKVQGYTLAQQDARDILETTPADALRELKADVWDEGFDTALDDIGAADAAREHGEDQNPYRKEQS